MADNSIALADGALNVLKELIPDDRIYNLVKDFLVQLDLFESSFYVEDKSSL